MEKLEILYGKETGSGSLYSNKLTRDELISNFVNKVLESFPSKS